MKKTLLSLVAIVAFACLANAQNVLTNPGFDGIDGPLAGRTADEWGMWSGNSGAAEVIDGVVNITPVASSNNWDMQVEQWGYTVVNGNIYTVSFDAWSDADRNITLTIEDPANGYRLLGATEDPGTIERPGRSKWAIDITTVQTRYYLTLTVDSLVANSTPKFSFLLAKTADKVYLDEVYMEEGNTVSIRDNKANAVKLYPNPANKDLYIANKSALSKVEIYNVVGTQVKVFSNVLKSVNVSDLKTGVYMVRLTDVDGKTVTSKFIKK